MTKRKKTDYQDNRTQALLEMSRALGSTCQLDDLLNMVVRYSMELLNAERATLFLYDKEHHELYSRIAEGAKGLRIPADAGLAGAAAVTLKVINVPDAYADERFNRKVDEQTGYHTRSILSCPLTDYEGQLVGVLQVLNKREGTFHEDDISLAEALSAQAGVALQRAHLLEEYLEKKRLEDSLRIAQEIQEKLLPRQAPHWEGFDIACWNRPCDATGGDFCDFLPLDHERLLITLGDVSGHGIGPALISCATRAMLRALSSVEKNIERVVQRVNYLTKEDLPDNRFVTAFTGILHNKKGQLHYCSAGQGPLVWLHARNNKVDILGAGAIPIGIIDDLGDLEPQVISFGDGDIFALLTDGFYEWSREDGELFGVERAIEVIRLNQQRTAGQILAAIKTAVEKFSESKQKDDLTAIIIKKLSCV